MATIIPDDGGAGGVFTPASMVIDDTNPSATFTYRPAAEGDVVIGVTNDSGFLDPPPLPYTAKLVALTYSVTGPPTIAKGVASAPFTVALPTGTITVAPVTITPNDGGAGGVFTPTSMVLSATLREIYSRDKLPDKMPKSASGTFTYTPAGGGNIAIKTTNDGGLADPAGLNYSIPLVDGDVVRLWPDSSPLLNDAPKAGKLSDSCPQGDTIVGLQDVQWWQFAQSFTAVGGRLHSAKFNLGPAGGCTGNVMAHLYASTGVIGSTAMPTGTPLATSEIKRAETMGAGWIEFVFAGGFNLVAGTVYCIAIDARAATGAPIVVYYWGAGTHAGNMSGQLGVNPWGAWSAGNDLPFQLYVETYPTFKENIVGPSGWPVVRFTAAAGDGFNLKTAISGTDPWTILAVFKPIRTSNAFVIAGSGGPALYYLNNGALYVQGEASYHSITYDGTGFTAGFHVVSATSIDLNTQPVWIDGVAQVQGGAYVDAAGTFSALGWRPNGSAYSDFDLAEVLIIGTLSTTDRQNAEATLAAKYGTPAPPAGSVIDLGTLPGLKGWWKADKLGLTPVSTGLKLWAEADSLILNDGDVINSWQNKVPGGTAGGPFGGGPVFKRNIANGHPVARFSGGQGFDWNDGPAWQPFTVFVVAKITNSGGIDFLLQSIGGSRLYLSNGLFTAGSGTDIADTADSSGAFHVFGYVANGSNGTGYVDGQSRMSGAVGANGYGGANGYLHAGASYWSTGDLAEILVYDHALSTIDMQSNQSYLKTKYGTP